MRKISLWLGFSALLLPGLYIAYPYYTVHRLGQALDSGDRVALEALVDWQSLRQGLKDDLNALLADAMVAGGATDEPGGLLARGLATMLGPTLIDRTVDSYLTPAGVARLAVNGGQIELGAETERAEEKPGSEPGRNGAITDQIDVTYAFFSTPDTFRIDVVNADQPEKEPLVAILQLRGLSWRLTRLILPELARRPRAGD